MLVLQAELRNEIVIFKDPIKAWALASLFPIGGDALCHDLTRGYRASLLGLKIGGRNRLLHGCIAIIVVVIDIFFIFVNIFHVVLGIVSRCLEDA